MTAAKQGPNEPSSSTEAIRKNDAVIGFTPNKRSSIPVGKLQESGIMSDNEEESAKKAIPQTPVQGRKGRHPTGKLASQTGALEMTASRVTQQAGTAIIQGHHISKNRGNSLSQKHRQ